MRRSLDLAVLNENRFDFPAYPVSWIQVAWSHELRAGEIRRLRCLGRELVLYRGQSGKACVMDAHCPHLGAHLAVGGRIVGDEIRCPFHGWQFDCEGHCTRVPHARKIPPKARLRAWPVREINGLILLWHDPSGRPPWFEVPSIAEYGAPGYSKLYSQTVTINTGWREILENGIDVAHLVVVHGSPELPRIQLSTEGPRYLGRLQMRFPFFGVPISGEVSFEGHGAGFIITRSASPLPFIVMSCPMPIDENRLELHMSALVSQKVPWPLRPLLTRLAVRTAFKEVLRDVPIWNHKMTWAHPVLCENDSHISKIRSWAKQFYPEQ